MMIEVEQNDLDKLLVTEINNQLHGCQLLFPPNPFLRDGARFFYLAFRSEPDIRELNGKVAIDYSNIMVYIPFSIHNPVVFNMASPEFTIKQIVDLIECRWSEWYEWSLAYNRWGQDCFEEFKGRCKGYVSYELRGTWEGTNDDEHSDEDLVKFSEDGGAYLGGVGFTHVNRAVTPWYESKHFQLLSWEEFRLLSWDEE